MSTLIHRASPEGRVKGGRETSPDSLLRFWFADEQRVRWFNGGAEFDQQLMRRYGPTVEDALSGQLDHWAQDAKGALALIVLLDQFTRNLFRHSAKAFAGDARARFWALQAISQGWHRQLSEVQQLFLYLPLEHSESLADQDRAVALMAPWAVQEHLAGFYHYAEKHRDVIVQFGRFPHRNEALERTSTPVERRWLDAGGGF
ncbi:DUF924 family protein [Chitinibacteraceae bacterium HSL-7]